MPLDLADNNAGFAHAQLKAFPPHIFQQNAQMHQPAAGHNKFFRRCARFNPQGDIALQFLVQPILDFAVGDELAIASGERPVIDAKGHVNGRLVNRDNRQRAGLVGTGNGIADINGIQAGHRADITCFDRIHLLTPQTFEYMQVHYLLLRMATLRINHRHRLAFRKFTGKKPTHRYTADIIGIFQKRHQHLRRGVRHIGRRRNVVDNRIENRTHRLAGNIQIGRGPTLTGGSVNDGKIQRLIIGVKLHQQIEYFINHIMRPGIGTIHLIDHHHRTQFILQSLIQHKPRLRHRPIERIHQQQHPIGHFQYPLHLAAKIGVAGRVNDVDFIFNALRRGIINSAIFAENRNAAFPLERIGIHNQVMMIAGKPVQLLVAKHARLVEQLIHQRGLAVIDMSDDGDVANVLHKGAHSFNISKIKK